MKWIGRIVLVGLVALLVWWVRERYFISDETRIKRQIAAAEQAVEQGNLIKLQGFIAQDYSDHYGHDKSTVLGGVRQFRQQYPQLFIHISDLTITVEADGQKAQAALIAKILAAPAADATQTEIRTERLRLFLRKTDQEWRMYRAEQPELKFE